MIKFIRFFSPVAIIILFAASVFSQTNTNMLKYWKYRDRLKYFVVPGDKHGESQIICVRNRIYADNDPINYGLDAKCADYGQHGLHTGYYLGVLATEYYLLNRNGQYSDAANTLDELHKALNAIIVYWDAAFEAYWPQFTDDPYNGFFMRGNVPCDFFSEDTAHPNGFTSSNQSDVDALNKGLTPANVWIGIYQDYPTYYFNNLPRGHPAYIDHRTACDDETLAPPNHDYTNSNLEYDPDHPIGGGHPFHPETMSGDEAVYLIMGCELTNKLVGGALGDLALDLKNRIILRLLNSYPNQSWDPGTPNPYRLFEPDGNPIREWEGGYAAAYAVPLKLQVGIMPGYYDALAWLFLSTAGIGYTDYAAIYAAITDSWPNTGASIESTTSDNDWETFYTFLWEVLQDETRPENKQEEIETKATEQLDSAPCDGPYCYHQDVYDSDQEEWSTDGIYSGGGWASTYRYTKDKDAQNHGSWFTGNYHGLDYMLCYNLYHILNYDDFPYYVNYADRNLAGYLPLYFPGMLNSQFNHPYYTDDYPARFAAFNSIVSTQVIGLQTLPIVTNDPGNVTYVAETSIHLRPGFHAMEGCYFHAYISNIDCNDVTSKMASDYPDNMWTPLYDSLISLPKTPTILTVETSDGRNNVIPLICPVDTMRFMGISGDTTQDYYSYFWDFGNGTTSRKKNPAVFYPPGSYDFVLVLTDTNAVSDTMRIIIGVPDCSDFITETPADSSMATNLTSYYQIFETGNQEEIVDRERHIWIVPNPNNGEMLLKSNSAFNEGESIVIFDMAGRLIYKETIHAAINNVQITTKLGNGVYIYAVGSNNNLKTNRYEKNSINHQHILDIELCFWTSTRRWDT